MNETTVQQEETDKTDKTDTAIQSLEPAESDLANRNYCKYFYSKLNNQHLKRATSLVDETDFCTKTFAWDWPFCDDHIAKCVLTKEKFFVCLPFSNGTGESKGLTKKFEDFSQSNISWSMGLCNDGKFATHFWRIEIEIITNLNLLVLDAWRDVSRSSDKGRRLRQIHKVYRLPDHYDIATLKTFYYEWAICIEVQQRTDAKKLPARVKRSISIA